jgi:4,5-dihydroxyphthalate decarboxylase
MAISIATPNEFASAFLADGRVEMVGFDVSLGWENGAAAYASAFTDPVYDVTILPLTNFLIARDKGLPLVGIPVFIDLFFPQMAIRVHKDSGITTPKELEGRRVGIRGFGFNPAVWIRGGMADVYGFDFTKVQWVSATPNSMSQVDLSIPAGLSIESTDPDLTGALETGAIDAVLYDRGGPALTANTVNIFDDPLTEVLRYYEQTGVFPLNSMLLAKREVLDANPGLGQAIVDAHDAARERYCAEVADEVTYMGIAVGWLRAHGMWPYHHRIENNRGALETIIRYTHEQGLISKRPAVESLFFDGSQ